MEKIDWNTTLKDYHETKKAIELLTKQLADKKGIITDFLKDQPEMKYSVGEGKSAIGFSLRQSPTYEYSSDVTELEIKQDLISEKIKKIKKQEVENGKAKIVHTAYSVYSK